ncbi:hypothetical protein [Glutamicibacter uratoxydans]|uniref:hypothetical protein n=1 Tax=Glutamicibacter uratoxydans TaxID=43667 RepID=UPI003D6FBD17
MSDSPANGNVQQAEGDVAALRAVLKDLGIAAVLEPVPRRGASYGNLAVLPDVRSPRIVIPTQPRKAARLALQRFSADLSLKSKVQRFGAALALAVMGSTPPLVKYQLTLKSSDEHNLLGHLAEIFSQEVLFSMSIGNERVNRKPVLQLFSRSGTCLGYAKIGTTALTSDLVRTEASALKELNSKRWENLRVPELIHSGTWNGHELLIMGYLPTTIFTRQATVEKLRISAQDELQRTFATTVSPLGEQDWWKELCSSTEDLAVRFAPAIRLNENLKRINEHYGRHELQPGASHGDWTAWNMAVHRSKLQVWDWERFSRGLPVGFDALHYAIHHQVSLTKVSKNSLLRGIKRSGVGDCATQLAYLAHLCGRYLQGLAQLQITATEDKAVALMETIECILGDLAHANTKLTSMDE